MREFLFFLWVWFWATLWLPVFFFSIPFRGKCHNCLSYAIARYLDEGGYVCFRTSRCYLGKCWVRYPHFLHLRAKDHVVLWQYREEVRSAFPKPYFQGGITEGDDEL